MNYTYKELWMEENERGGIAFGAEILDNGKKIASLNNKGIGGCNTYYIEDQKAWTSFVAVAKLAFPDLKIEQEDALVEALWEKSLV